MELESDPQERAGLDHLPKVLVLSSGGSERALALPAWPETVEGLAISEMDTIRDEDLLVFWFGVRACTFMPSRLMQRLAATARVPGKHRNSDRARTWIISRWHRRDVRLTILAYATFTDLPVPIRHVLRELGDMKPGEAASVISTILKHAADYSPDLPARLYAACYTGLAPEGTADILLKDPRVPAAIQGTLDELKQSGLYDTLRGVLVALEILSADRQTRFVTESPEALVPGLQHELEEARNEIGSLREQLATLTEQRDALELELEETVALYELALSDKPAEGTSGGEGVGPLAGLRVTIAGDPSHTEGYRRLCVQLGAAEVEILDAVSDPPRRIAERLARADVPVLVTAYAKHRTQRAAETLLDRDRLILVPVAGLHAFQVAVLAAMEERV